MFRKALSALRSARERTRRVLLAMWVEARRPVSTADGYNLDVSGDYDARTRDASGIAGTGSADRRLIPAAGSSGIAQRTPYAGDGDYGPTRSSVSIRDGFRRSYIAIEAPSTGTGVVAARDRSQLTLAALQRGIAEIRSQGFEPDGIVLLESEAKVLLEENFRWRRGDSWPSEIKIMGLPVRVQE